MWNSNTRKKIAIVLVLTIAVGLMPQREMAYAAPGVPKILNYQGRLLSATGTLLGGASGASYCFKFSLYDAVSGGSKVWPSGNPATSTITITNGVFNAGIGDTGTGGDALNYDFQSTSTVFLEIQVGARGGDGNCNSGGDETMETLSPRQQVFSAGFAINSDTVDGFHAIERATSTQVPVLSNGELILGSSTPSVSATGTNALTLQNRSSGNINFFSSATATLTTAGTLTIAGLLQSAATGNSYFSGNLGIGLTSPSVRLEIAGTASSTGLVVNGTATTTQLYVGSSTIIVNNLTVDTNTFFVDAANGRVGIGTTTPGTVFSNSPPTLESAGSMMINTTQPQLYLWESDQSADNKLWDIQSTGNQLQFRALNDANSAEGKWLTVDRTGTTIDTISFPNGNFGIGTASPGAKLDVAGTASSTGLVVNGIATTTNLNITSFTNGSILFATSSGLVSQDNSNLFWDDTNNRLGIGTASPGAKLQVTGTTGDTSGIRVTGNNLTGGFFEGGGSDFAMGTISNNIAEIITNGAPRITITAGGKVAIGNHTATAQLDMGSSINARTISFFDNGSTNAWGVETNNNLTDLSGSWYSFVDYGGLDFLFRSKSYASKDTLTTSGTVIMAIKNSGNVGIGTTAPVMRLHVATTTEGNVMRLADGTETCDLDPDASSITQTCSSDTSLKMNVKDASSSLSSLSAYRVREFDVIKSGEHKIGVIAQELQAVYPDKVKEMVSYKIVTSTDAEGNVTSTIITETTLGVESPNPWELVKAIQELKTKTDALATGVCDLTKGGICVDVAENFPTAEKVSAGDIVMIDQGFSKTTSTRFAVKKATQETPQIPPIGIVSTNPAILIEGYKTSFGGAKLEGEYGPGIDAPVALIGRVPVKISIENGEIKPGDPLAVSSISGVAAKATAPGWIIGIALESTENASNEEIIVFVNPTWWGGESAETDTGLFANIASAVKTALESLGIFIQNGVAYIERITTTYIEITKAEIEEANIGVANIKHLRVENDVEFIDKATGEPYCAWLENGAWVRERGSCAALGETAPEIVPETTPTEEETQATSTPPDETIATSTSSEVENNNE